MRTIIAGSRNFTDGKLAFDFLDKIRGSGFDVTEIVSGTATGADRIGEAYAKVRGISLKCFPADWKTYGRRAGILRNEQMARYAEACVVFWDGESRGSANMIDIANRCNLPLIVVYYKTRVFTKHNF